MDKDTKQRDNRLKLTITGASGFLGYNLIKELSDSENFSINCLVRKSTDVSQLKKLNVDLAICNLFDNENVKNSIINSDVIIHLATLFEGHKTKDKIYNSNVLMTKNILENISENQQLIFASTNVALDPHSFYATSKVKCEEMIQSQCKNFTIVRIAPILGPNSNSKSAALIRKINTNYIIPIPGHGNQVLQPVHVKDVISAIISVIHNKKYFNRICSIASAPITLESFVDLTAKILNRRIKKIHIPLEPLIILIKFFEQIGIKPELTSGQINDLRNLTNENALQSDFPITDISKSIKDSL